MEKRIVNIDFLKCIACLAVIGLHMRGFLYPLCSFAVPVFFVCSGYLNRKKETIDGWKVLSKTLKIVETVFLWALLWLTFPQVFLFSHGWNGPWYQVLIETVWSSLTQKDIWQFWYFGGMILVMGFSYFLRLGKWEANIDKIQTRIWLILLIYGWIFQVFSMFVFHVPVQQEVNQTFRIWTWIQYYLLGGIICSKESAILKKLSLETCILLLILLSVLSCVVQWLGGTYLIQNDYGEYYYDDIIVIAWVASITILVLRLDLEKYRSLITKVASLTMGVYIIHPFVQVWITESYIIETEPERVICYIAVVIISSAITFLISKIPIAKRLVTLT